MAKLDASEAFNEEMRVLKSIDENIKKSIEDLNKKIDFLTEKLVGEKEDSK